jgi:hypothetical protein
MEAPQNQPPQEQAIVQQGAQPQQPRLPEGFKGAPLTAAQGFEQSKA